MNSLLVVGSVAIDSVESPYGKRDECFGGSASYFSYAASFFTPVKLVAVVGKDFPDQFRAILAERAIDLSGLEVAPGKTFRWKGKYEGDLNVAQTLDTQLNVFETFRPVITDTACDFLFLANIHPLLQMNVLDQVKKHVLVASDTMNHWIRDTREDLVRVLRRVDMLIINDMEARELTGESHLLSALETIRTLGPSKIVIKKGEHGVLASFDEALLALPAYPLKEVCDPTGAGDSFAGGLMGALAEMNDLSLASFRRAVSYGIVVASFTVERFGLERLREITRADIEKRLVFFNDMVKC